MLFHGNQIYINFKPPTYVMGLALCTVISLSIFFFYGYIATTFLLYRL